MKILILIFWMVLLAANLAGSVGRFFDGSWGLFTLAIVGSFLSLLMIIWNSK